MRKRMVILYNLLRGWKVTPLPTSMLGMLRSCSSNSASWLTFSATESSVRKENVFDKLFCAVA